MGVSNDRPIGALKKIGKILLSFYVYILRCIDLSYYTGHTDNIDGRISAHEQGLIKTCYTYTKRPVYIVYVAEFGSRGVLRQAQDARNTFAWIKSKNYAIEVEKQIKGWSRKKK